ncbi:unnamed protein product [Closterium sp. NIES-53]
MYFHVIVYFREQKWSKGKQKEKVNNMVLFDQATYDKMLTEIPKTKLITSSVLCDRLRVSILCACTVLSHHRSSHFDPLFPSRVPPVHVEASVERFSS